MLTLFFQLEQNKYQQYINSTKPHFNSDKQLKVEFCFSNSLNLLIAYIMFLTFIQNLYF